MPRCVNDVLETETQRHLGAATYSVYIRACGHELGNGSLQVSDFRLADRELIRQLVFLSPACSWQAHDHPHLSETSCAKHLALLGIGCSGKTELNVIKLRNDVVRRDILTQRSNLKCTRKMLFIKSQQI